MLKLWGIKVTSKDEIKQESWLKTWRNWLIYKSNNTSLELDVPLKRFLVFTGYYLVFVGFLMMTILDHTDLFMNHHIFGKSETFSNGYTVLTIFAVSSIWQDIYSFATHRSLTSYFKFWRVYDMVMHLGLILALSLRGARRISILYIDPNNKKLDLLRAEGLVFAVVSTSALLR